MVWSKNDLTVYHRKQVNSPPNMKLATSLMNFECHPCGIFESFSYHQKHEAIDTTIFAATVGLGDRIKKLVSSDFMGMLIAVSVIFFTGANYLCSSNKGDFVKLKEKNFSRNIKGTPEGLQISRFETVGYSVRNESVRIIALQDQAYYVPGLPKDFYIIYTHGNFTSEG